MQLLLSADEATFLRTTLAQRVADLRTEVVRTEDYDLRQALKQDEALAERLIERIGGLMLLKAEGAAQ